jgi:hypothetical protein
MIDQDERARISAVREETERTLVLKSVIVAVEKIRGWASDSPFGFPSPSAPKEFTVHLFSPGSLGFGDFNIHLCPKMTRWTWPPEGLLATYLAAEDSNESYLQNLADQLGMAISEKVRTDALSTHLFETEYGDLICRHDQVMDGPFEIKFGWSRPVSPQCIFNDLLPPISSSKE